MDKIQLDFPCLNSTESVTDATVMTNLTLPMQSMWSLEDVLLQQPNMRPMLSIRRDNMRISLRIFMCLWSVAILQQIILLYLWRQERRLWAAGESHGRIICFIHQKDGEKEEHILPTC